MTKGKVIFGNALLYDFAKKQEDYKILFRDKEEKDKCFFSLNEEMLAKHILMLGGPGCGKTNVFNMLLKQLREKASEKDVFIIFDTKGDFYQNFAVESDYVIGNSKEYRNASESWNLFEEVLADGTNPMDYELNAREIANSLFEDRGSTAQPFFVNAAKDIFAQVIIYFIRKALEKPEDYISYLNNQSLVDFLIKTDNKKYEEIFNSYTDMKGVLSYLGDGTSNQALGVLAELKNMLYDLFIGVFKEGEKKGRFSIRKAIRQKKSKAIFIEYDLRVGETMTPIYRLLVDLALKEALGRSETEKGNVYVILDELKLLPKLSHLDDALNFGRSMGVKVVAGLQSINQLYDIYGELKGKVIAGGFSTLFAFHTSDYASREYVTSLFGKNIIVYQYLGIDRMMEKKEREGNTVEIWDQTQLKVGEAIVGLVEEDTPFFFQFERYNRG